MKFLVANGMPSTVELDAAASLEQAVVAKCGHYRTVYETALRRLNEGTLDAGLTAQRAGTYKLPACAHFEQDATVRISADVNLGDFLERETGFRGRKTMASFLARNTQLGPLTATSVLTTGTVVHLEYRSEWVNIALKPESGLTVDQAKHRLGQLVAAGRRTTEPSAVTQDNAVGATLSEVPNERSRCGVRPASTPWPYDVGSLVKALNRAKAAADASGRRIREARVAVLDSAFPVPPAGPLTWERLATLDGPPGPRDYYGLNADTRTDPPLKIAGIKDGDHGTLVSTLALGGAEFLDTEARTLSQVRLRLYSVVELGEPDGSGVRQTKVREDDVAFAIDDATREHETYIINGSFEFPLEMLTIIPLVQREPKLLLVAAAGNKPDNVDIRPRWPASFGGGDGPIARQVLTVGASNSAKDRARFSSTGFQKVDLLAPGCGVPSFALDLSRREVNGTSFAAPLAAFTAALVRQFGITNGARLKERLLVATDVHWGLYYEVWAAGILNPAKALELFSDYVELNGSSEPLRGQLDWSSTGVWRCAGNSEEPTRGRILKVARLERPNMTTLWLVIWRTRNNDLRRCQVDLSGEFITLIKSDGDERTVVLADVKDLISAHDF